MKVKTKLIGIRLSEKQMEMLNKLSELSLKSKSVLIREAVELLFKSPGGTR